MSEEAAQKAHRMGGLLTSLLELLLQLRNLRLGLIERNILHQYRLRQNVQRIGVVAQGTVQQRLGVSVFFLELCLVDFLDERIQKLFFLGSHC